ncbi:elongation factor P [Azospirillum sp. 11R-A]|jgi:elongation factor P|uniref:Elongation factor P n=1 Tax=Azospirillum endophyticum TaxID=2800326 RepID=A0ABS1FD39_9PROT|nr:MULTISPECIES: elongation factor P [Azospirillum]MBK1841330.1 elongation factor P [Azospirillum endophyticum]PWC47616.1 elongation factor P [Azospirillum sp. TSA6c]PWC78188.1 elongation factor P [Azospirillum sp. TSH64]
MKVNANTMRPGHVLEHNGKLWVITKTAIVQPGKGGAFIQLEMKDVRTGNKSIERFRTQETVERARLDEHEMTFLFAEGDSFTFMDKESFEQVAIPRDIIGEPAVFLQDGMEVTVQSHEGSPLGVEIPGKVTLLITESDPVVKGQTASSSYKPAKLENGVSILVPPHIEAGTRVVVDTASGEYVERAKD